MACKVCGAYTARKEYCSNRCRRKDMVPADRICPVCGQHKARLRQWVADVPCCIACFKSNSFVKPSKKRARRFIVPIESFQSIEHKPHRDTAEVHVSHFRDEWQVYEHDSLAMHPVWLRPVLIKRPSGIRVVIVKPPLVRDQHVCTRIHCYTEYKERPPKRLIYNYNGEAMCGVCVRLLVTADFFGLDAADYKCCRRIPYDIVNKVRREMILCEVFGAAWVCDICQKERPSPDEWHIDPWSPFRPMCKACWNMKIPKECPHCDTYDHRRAPPSVWVWYDDTIMCRTCAQMFEDLKYAKDGE